MVGNKCIQLTCIILLALSLGPSKVGGQTPYGQQYGEKYRRAIAKEIAYGKEEEMVGMVYVQDQPRLGPESFSNDSEGNLYVCDGVNQRIQIFSQNGKHQSTIFLEKGMRASDVAIDRSGFIYVYDAQGKLYQYDRKGNLLRTIDVDSSRWQVRMAMHMVGGNIYIRNVDQEDVLIGKVIKGALTAPTTEELAQPPEKGIHGSSGRRYILTLLRWQKGVVEMLDTSGTTVKIEMPIKDIVSTTFLQEDNQGNFYIQTERVEDNKIVLEVHKFDAQGNLLTVIPIPDTNYSTWTIKLLSLDDEGNIYQFLPGKEKAQLNVFQRE